MRHLNLSDIFNTNPKYCMLHKSLFDRKLSWEETYLRITVTSKSGTIMGFIRSSDHGKFEYKVIMKL